jgi:2-oxo-3-hexenedioate decarboxylase
VSEAQYLDGARRSATAVAQFAPGMTLEQAYRVQHELLALRTARGERIAGTKLGFTSAAKMAQMGVSEIIVGQLTDAMQVSDGGTADLGGFIHPRIEPEVAFRLARDVEGDIAACVDAVAPALEIIDSRYRNFTFSLPDVVADNTSAAAFVVGTWTPLPAPLAELPDWAVELVVEGAVAEKGSTADILGRPANALRALVPLAAKHGFPLTAGQVILAGAATAAVAFTESTVEARVAGLGSVSVRASRGEAAG